MEKYLFWRRLSVRIVLLTLLALIGGWFVFVWVMVENFAVAPFILSLALAIYYVIRRVLLPLEKVNGVLRRLIADAGDEYEEGQGNEIERIGASVAILERTLAARADFEAKYIKSDGAYRYLIDSVPDPIYRYDRNCCRVYVNPVVERLSGKSAAMLLGKSPTEASLVSSAESVKVQQSIQRCLDTGAKTEVEVLFVAPDGRELHFQNILVPEIGADGRVEGVLSIGRDITARKRMEQVLLDSEREYRTLSENLPVNVMRYDRDCRVRYMNKNIEETLGVPAAYVVGKTPSEVFSDGMFDELELVLQGVIETGKTVDYDIIMPDSGKGERYHRLTLTPEKNERGEVIGVLNIGRDITEQKRYEQELLARVELEQRLSSFINSAPGFFYTARLYPDGTSAMPFTSPRIKELFGLSSEAVAHSLAPLFAMGYPEDIAILFERRVESARSLSPLHCEFRITHPEKGERWIELNSLPHREEDGCTVWHGSMQDITERKMADKQLKLLNYAIDHVNQEVFLVEKNADLSYVNDGASRGRGYTREELLKMNITVLDPNFPMERWPHHWHELKENGSLLFETLHTKKDGRTFPVEISANYFDFEGTGYNLSLVHDITERKRMEEQLRLKEYALNHSGDAVFLIDEEARFLYINEQACNSLGYSRAELSKLSAPDIDPDYSLEKAQGANEKAIAEGAIAFETRHQRRDGSVFPVEIKLSVLEYDGHTLTMAMVRNITERKQAEDLLKERFDHIVDLNNKLEVNARDLEDQAAEYEAQAVELEASQEQIKLTEAWYRGIVRSAPDGMVVVNESGNIALVNLNVEKMFGYAEGELIGQPIEMLLPLGVRQGHVAKRNGFFAGGAQGRPMVAVVNGLRARRKDGSEFPVDVSLSRLPDLDGRAGVVCAAIRDISERHKMELARESALSEALRLAQLRSAFLAQMSHELRTPLNGILGYVQNLLQGEALVEKQVDGLRIIQHSGEHLLSLINGILDHAAIEADKFELIPDDIELEPFLCTIIGIIRVRAEQKNIAFVCEADAGLPAIVRGDAQRLRQILLNLLSNAVKFTDKGQVTLRLNCATPSRLYFAVQDSGVGISAEQMENIFLPFEQVGETSRRAGGTGLGLAISRKLVTLMGGDIKVESQPGAGSTFSFEIEMAAIQPGAATVNVAALSEQALTRASQAKPLLHMPPRPELDILHGLALRGNMRDVIKHADHLAELDEGYLPFADHLRQLAKSFQTKALVSLIEQYRNGK